MGHLHLLLRPKFWGDPSAGGPFPSSGSSLIVRGVFTTESCKLKQEPAPQTGHTTGNTATTAGVFSHNFPYVQRHSNLIELLNVIIEFKRFLCSRAFCATQCAACAEGDILAEERKRGGDAGGARSLSKRRWLLLQLERFAARQTNYLLRCLLFGIIRTAAPPSFRMYIQQRRRIVRVLEAILAFFSIASRGLLTLLADALGTVWYRKILQNSSTAKQFMATIISQS